MKTNKNIKSFKLYRSYILEDNRSKKLIFHSDYRNHYVYRITDLNKNKHYYGSRVTKLEPVEDIGIKYFSSSSVKDFILEQKIRPEYFRYKIIKIFDNPGDCIIYESYLHQYFKVSSNANFINLSNQMPFGWTTTGNIEVIQKGINTKRIIQKSGLTRYEEIAITSSNTLNTIQPSGLTKAQETGIKISKYKNKTNPITGNTFATDSAILASKTMAHVNPITGKSIYQISGRKGKKTKSQVNPITGKSIYQISGRKISKKLNIIQKSGLKLSEEIALKSSITRKIVQSSGLNINQEIGYKQTGYKNHRFSGYYITPFGIFASSYAAEEELDISSSSIRKYCRNKILITSRSYNKMKKLSTLGSKNDIVGKTSTELGFSFNSV